MVAASPIPYGWVVLAAATVGLTMTIPGQTIGVSVVLDPIIDELGLGRSVVSATYTAGTLAGSLWLAAVGRRIDRYGPRRSVAVIATAFALACAAFGLVGGVVGLVVGFTLIRGLGQGALGLVSVHAVNSWFVRRRGLAMGLAGFGFAIATALVPPRFQQLVDAIGWRWSYVVAGAVVAAVMVPVGWAFFRDRPEAYGLQPDGTTPSTVEPVVEVDYELAQARRTLTFWLYVTGGFLTAALGTALVFHHFSIMAANGLERDVAASLFVPFGFVLAGSGLVTGYLIDRVPPRFLLSAALALMAGALVGAPGVDDPRTLLVYGVVLGTMQGMSQALQTTVYAHYFGRLHIGAIKGLSTTILVAGTSVGPLLVALGFDAAGDYRPVLVAAAVAPAVLAVVAPFLPLVRDGRVR